MGVKLVGDDRWIAWYLQIQFARFIVKVLDLVDGCLG